MDRWASGPPVGPGRSWRREDLGVWVSTPNPEDLATGFA